MMRNDPMPSVSVGLIVPTGAPYDGSHYWRNDAGALRASVSFRAGGYSYASIQGDPAALRELACALVEAAGRAEDGRALAAAEVAAEGVAR